MTADHRKAATGQTALCGVLTVSDTRTKETDRGGRIIIDALQRGGHSVQVYEIVKDDPLQIDHRLDKWLTAGQLDVIITTGGTGLSTRDTTVEVVACRLDKRIEGFGELFRMLSWDQVGPAAMLSGALGGLAGETLIFVLPGSPAAVELAMSRLIIPELPHMIWERRR